MSAVCYLLMQSSGSKKDRMSYFPNYTFHSTNSFTLRLRTGPVRTSIASPWSCHPQYFRVSIITFTNGISWPLQELPILYKYNNDHAPQWWWSLINYIWLFSPSLIRILMFWWSTRGFPSMMMISLTCRATSSILLREWSTELPLFFWRVLILIEHCIGVTDNCASHAIFSLKYHNSKSPLWWYRIFTLFSFFVAADNSSTSGTLEK